MKLSEYENPLTGKQHNLFDLSSLLAQILGVFVLVVTFMFGQKIADYFFPQKKADGTDIASTRIYL
jgi:hypothetical protein